MLWATAGGNTGAANPLPTAMGWAGHLVRGPGTLSSTLHWVVDAGVCGLLGVGVKYGSAPSRWLLAVYAFVSPILVIRFAWRGALAIFLFCCMPVNFSASKRVTPGCC
jgi:hypothetical protein